MEAKTEKVFVKGPFWPNNSYIVIRKIQNGDIESNIKVYSRETRKRAEKSASELCNHRNLEFGGFLNAEFMEKEPR